MGKTDWTGEERAFFEKHPHGRGEDTLKMPISSCSKETPPRAWGRRILHCQVADGHGNTPTGVGKTNVLNAALTSARKHPHGRGEDRLRAVRWRGLLETPPRAWGRLAGFSVLAKKKGNTPTGVGKTEDSFLGG